MLLPAQPTFMAQSQYLSLHALSVASRLFEKLPGATIPLSILSLPLFKASWVPPLPTRDERYYDQEVNDSKF
jgi:hypothetical protein